MPRSRLDVTDREHSEQFGVILGVIFPDGNNCWYPIVIERIIPEREHKEVAMKYTPARLGELVKDTRTKMGLTQEKLAMAAGTGLRFIIDLEKGKPTCQLGKALIVLNTLGIKMTLTSPVAKTSGALSLRSGSGKSDNGSNA